MIIDEVPEGAAKQALGSGSFGPRGQRGRVAPRTGGRGTDAGPDVQRRSGKAPSHPARQAARRATYLISIDLFRDLPFRMTGFTFQGGDKYRKEF